MAKINAAIIGISGYTGIEALRILLNHKHVNILNLAANANANKDISEIYPAFSGYNLPKIIKFEEVDFTNIDVAFFCLPHGTSQSTIIQVYNQHKHVKIIDLSADFRLKSVGDYQKWYGLPHLSDEIQQSDVAYGLPEFYRTEIKQKRIIACPGCYPTSAILPLKPLIENNLISKQSIIIDSKSGLTGSGRKETVSNLFSERNETATAYGLFSHRHNSELIQELGSDVNFIFTPHVIPINRGIISTIYAKKTDIPQNIQTFLSDFYKNEPFIEVLDFIPQTKDVSGTNRCRIYTQSKNDNLIIVSAIDNLCKGSSGQAVQNMNIAFGFDEIEGLNFAPIFP